MSKEWNRLNAATRLIFQSSSKQPPNDRLRVFVGTWNMYGRLLPIDLATIVSTHQDEASRYHILAIGTQECERDISESLLFPSKEIWEKRLSEFLGTSYTMLKSETLAALHLAVFVWTPLLDRVQAVKCDKIKTGWANMIGNKGAVAISLQFGSRKLLFINCHLRAHQANLSERNANVQRILHELNFDNCKHDQSTRQSTMSLLRRLSRRAGTKPKKDKKQDTTTNTSVLEEFDHVFFFGDTNYRINADRPWVLERIKSEDYKSLLEFDQLSVERRSGNCPLAPFKEHPINFPPTYKLDANPSLPTSPTSSSSSSSYKDWFSNHTSTSQKSSISKHSSSSPPVPPVPPLPASIKSDTNAVASSSSSAAAAAQQQRQAPKHSESEPTMLPVVKTTTKQRSQSAPVTPGSRVSAAELIYDTSPKQRIPSWTDRILWYDRQQQQQQQHLEQSNKNTTTSSSSTSKIRLRFTLPKNKASSNINDSNINKDTVCYRYEAILDESLVGVSDHMPVVGEFGIYFDEWQEKCEQPKKRPFWLSRKKSEKV